MVHVLSYFWAQNAATASVVPKATFMFKGIKSVAVSSFGHKYYVQSINRVDHIFMIKRTNSWNPNEDSREQLTRRAKETISEAVLYQA